MLVLAGHAEQVALVVMQDFAVRSGPEQAVAVAAVGRLDDHAGSDHGIQPHGLFTHPTVGRALLRLGQLRRVHGKAGGEHLRQDDQIGAARLLQQLGEMRAVGRGILPDQAGLDQGQFEVGQHGQIAHSLSAAWRSVSSCLAKQKRTSRRFAGGDW